MGIVEAQWAKNVKVHQETAKTTYVSYITNGIILGIKESYINNIFIAALRDPYVPAPPNYNKEALITAIVIAVLVNVAYAFYAISARIVPFSFAALFMSLTVEVGVKVLEGLFCIILASLLAIAMIVPFSDF